MELRTNDDLRTLYRPAQGGAVDKVIDHIDEHCRDFLARSPLMVLSTADENGVCDGSPKGGEPGFVRALDGHRIAWADSSGNNRLDSFENVVANPSVAALFLIPGLSETLRINGTAELTTDPELCEQLSLGGRAAKVVVVVTVAEAYIHCAKALRRAGVWDTETWPADEDIPDAICMLRDHAAIPAETETIREVYDADVEATLWAPGGGNVDT
ncbi:MAG: MSMEG_1061 family FMN-dependent PPOX-type flavoprotein [Actinomycetota bacterium]